MTELIALREKHEALRLQAATMELAEAVRIMELQGRMVDIAEGTAWGETLPYSEYPEYDEWFYRNRRLQRSTAIEDRQDGKFLPIFGTEQDLRWIRALARYLSPTTAICVGAIDSLYNYVFGEGFSFTVQPAEDADPPEQWIQRAQYVIDRFLDDNDWVGVLDRDMHQRSREDGEWFAQFKFRRDGGVSLSVIEPEQVVEPLNPRALDDWLLDERGLDIPCSWTFGVHTPRRDTSKPLGYHVVYDATGNEWDYVDERYMVHVKRNVTVNVKRGLSDFYPIARDILADDKLTRNLGIGAAVIAAIVGVRKHSKGQTQANVQTMLGQNDSGTITKPNRDGSTRSVRRLPYDEGTILDIGGHDWVDGPLGARNNPNLLMVQQGLRRTIGVRWTMPEYLVSGDASNASYASTSVAAEAWVKAREADQRFFGRWQTLMLWKVLRIAADNGAFGGAGWPEIESAIEINNEAPEVATKDFLALAHRQEIELRMGTLSLRTAASEQGRDLDQERQNMEQDGDKPSRTIDPPPLAPGVSPAAVGALQGAMEDALQSAVHGLTEDCGTGAGGFKASNTCAAGGGGGGGKSGGDAPKGKVRVEVEHETKKALLISDGKRKGWIQKRWMDSDGNVSERVFAKAADEFERREGLKVKAQEFKNASHEVRVDLQTEKAVGTKVTLTDPSGEQHIERVLWFPKSQLKDGKVPGWMIHDRLARVVDDNSSQHMRPFVDPDDLARLLGESLRSDEARQFLMEEIDPPLPDEALGESIVEDCGTGAGGFKGGNTCAGEGGGGSGAVGDVSKVPKQASTGTRGRKSAAKSAAPPQKKNTVKAARAKASHNPATKAKQTASDDLEIKLSKALGLKRTGDNLPMDNISADGRIGIEVKMMHDAKDDKVHMRKDSRQRKEAWVAEQKGRKAYTVLIDNRDKFEGGKHKGKYSGHKIYFREGVGAFRLNGMQKASGIPDLKRRLGL